MTWRDDALCAETDPDMFFPEPNMPAHDAKRICAVCPVTYQCLTYALPNDWPGVWGGTTPNERKTLRRALSREGSAA